MENPCYQCICVAICKYKDWNELLLSCELIGKYLNELECFVPLNSYRVIDLKPINQKFEVRKNSHGNCRWFRDHIKVGTSTHY